MSHLCAGLQSLNFLDIMRQIPDTFRPLFVYGESEASDLSSTIVSCLLFPANMSRREAAIVSLLKNYLRERSHSGEYKYNHKAINVYLATIVL